MPSLSKTHSSVGFFAILYKIKVYQMSDWVIVVLRQFSNFSAIRVITKLPNSEQSYKGKVITHKYINRQN